MKNRIVKTKAKQAVEAKPAVEPLMPNPKAENKLKTEYMLSLTVWEVDEEDGMGDGETVASVEISTKLFAKILHRADCLNVAPGQFLEEMATDAVRYNSATVERLEVA